MGSSSVSDNNRIRHSMVVHGSFIYVFGGQIELSKFSFKLVGLALLKQTQIISKGVLGECKV